MMMLHFLLPWCLIWMLAQCLGLLTEKGHTHMHTHTDGGRGRIKLLIRFLFTNRRYILYIDIGFIDPILKDRENPRSTAFSSSVTVLGRFRFTILK